MKVPLSWLKECVDITIPVEELARRLTWAGLEVDEIRMVGLPCRRKRNTRRRSPVFPGRPTNS